MTEKFLIVGLGNPGREFRLNRHNIGFMLLDRLAEQHGMGGFTRRQGQALVTSGEIAGASVVLAKPQTYMNLSGQAVSTLMRFYGLPNKNLLICLDDIDLPIGTLRVRAGGGSAGQRGLQSIIDQLGTTKFARLRIGVGRPLGNHAAAGHVLGDLKGEDWEIINLTMSKALDAFPLFITDGVVLTMSRFNGPAPAPAKKEASAAEAEDEIDEGPKRGQVSGLPPVLKTPAPAAEEDEEEFDEGPKRSEVNRYSSIFRREPPRPTSYPKIEKLPEDEELDE